MAKANIFYENKGKKYNYRNPAGTPYFRKSVTINGKVKTVYGDGEKDCLAKIEELKKLEGQGLDIDKQNCVVEPTMEQWLMEFKRVDQNLKASSFARYESSYRVHIKGSAPAQLRLKQLSSTVMQKYINELYEDDGLSGETIKSIIRVWRMFCLWAVEEGYIIKNPCRNVTIPGKRTKGKRHFETFTLEERQAITGEMERCDYWYRVLILLAFDTGMRQGELLGLQWDDIADDGVYVRRSVAVATHVDKDGDRNRYTEVWDTKTVNSERFIPLRPAMLRELLALKAERTEFFTDLPEHVFTTNTGRIVDPTSLAKSYRRLLNRAGVEYRKFHAMRHTFATEAIRQGVNLKDLQMLMGHSNIETTLLYIQSSEESKRKAIDNMESLVGLKEASNDY